MSDDGSVTLKFDLKLTLLCALLLPFLLFLGFWQLDRAEQKRQLLLDFSEAKQKPAVSWHDSNLENYRLVSAAGKFDSEHYWLLDNRVKQGRVGFDVIMPFYTGGQLLMVNRGWVRGDLSRKSLPKFKTPAGRLTIVGRVYRAQTNKPTYATAADWPKIIGYINTQEMADQINNRDPKGVLRLQIDSQGALQTGWPEVNVSVEKHLGYALQWFVMSLACVILFLLYGSNSLQWLKKDKNDKRGKDE